MNEAVSTKELFLVVAGLISFFATAFAWIAFARISMARIEKDIQNDGLPRPASWDGTGARALWYCYAIALPVGIFNLPNDPFFDSTTVRRYAGTPVRGSA